MYPFITLLHDICVLPGPMWYISYFCGICADSAVKHQLTNYYRSDYIHGCHVYKWVTCIHVCFMISYIVANHKCLPAVMPQMHTCTVVHCSRFTDWNVLLVWLSFCVLWLKLGLAMGLGLRWGKIIHVRIFGIFCAKNYEDRFKLLYVIEENLADILLWYVVVDMYSVTTMMSTTMTSLFSRSVFHNRPTHCATYVVQGQPTAAVALLYMAL